MRRARAWLPCVFVIAAAACFYFHSLDSVPWYIGGDEANAGIQARSLATSGRDLTGKFLPLFVNVEDPLPEFRGNRWWQPVLVYLQAGALLVLPFSEWSLRIPSVTLAMVNVALIYALARRLFGGVLYPTVAAALLAMTPIHFMFARMAVDYFLPVTVVLAWLLCLQRYLETHTALRALATGLVLGIGIYTHVVSWVFMPICLAITIVTLLATAWPSPRPAAAALLGFAMPLLLIIPWVFRAPEMLSDLLGSYRVVQGNLTLLQNIRDKLNYNNVQDKVGIYWDYFNPSMLFFSGGAHLTQGTRKVGAFLLPVAVFLAVGFYDALRRIRSPMMAVLIAGFVVSPIPATLRGEPYYIARSLVMVPFAVLLAVHGVAAMRAQPSRAVRAFAVALLGIMPLQFAMFARDYFGDYQLRVVYWFDNMNFRGVAEHLIARDQQAHVPAFYLADNLDDGGSRWLFYLIKYKHEDLWPRTRGFDPAHADVAQMPAGSLLVLYANDATLQALLASGACALDASIGHATGAPATVILRKVRS